MQVDRMLELAATVAVSDDLRNYRLGCVAIRQDGVCVRARNASSTTPCPSGHAERRVLRKAGKGAVVFVSRVARNGDWALAKPCAGCLLYLSAMKATIYYTMSPGEWARL